MEKKSSKKRWMKVFLTLMLGILILSSNMYAQGGTPITITGNVKDANNEPIISGSVVIKGTTTGTVTDLDGNYELNAPADGILVFTYLGFKTQEIAINGKTTIDVILEEDIEMLKEVVVIGYGSVRREDLTGAVTAIKADEINRGAVTSPQELIQGKVPGVFIQPGSGQPGAGSTIRIRSGASLNASNDPLIVIDGVPVSNDAAPGMANGLASVNPNDIETFTVLKDASATAIYGSRASNGVIIITTKKGAAGKPKVTYSSTVSMHDPYNKTKTLNASEYREAVTSTFANNAKAMEYLNMYPTQSTNWQDLIYRTAYGTDQNLNISGTTLNTPYRVSLGYTSDAGTLKNSVFERFSLGANLSHKLFRDHLSINLNLKGMINNNRFADTGAVGAAAFFDPTKPAYSNKGELNDFNGFWNWVYPDGMANTLSGVNPLSLLHDNRDSGKTKRSIGNIQLDYKMHFLPELRANLNLGYDIARGEGFGKGAIPGSFQAAKDSDVRYLGQVSDWSNFRRNQLMDFYLNYDKEFEKIESRINVMGGYSWQWFYQSDRDFVYSNGIPSTPPADGWEHIKGNDFYTKVNTGLTRPAEYYLISFFGRFNYTFKNRYLLTATLRRDGSSRFSEDNRWGMFPSAALAWTISNESFMQNQSLFSNLKLRLSYGKTGQQDVGDFYPYIPNYIFSTNPNSMYLGQYLLKPLAYNRNLKWEETETYNIGLDYGFLQNRINGSIEVYKKKTADLLFRTDIAAGTNFSNRFLRNIGKMENQGVEFNINAAVIDTKDFSWDAGFNVTWNKSEITSLTANDDPNFSGININDITAGTGGPIAKFMVGYAPHTYFTYQQVYDEAGKPIQNTFVDRNGDGEITDDDRYLGYNPMPKWFMGFSSQFRYKQFDLGFNLRANLGNRVFNDVAAGNATTQNAFGGQGFLTNLHETVFRTGFTEINKTPQNFSDLFVENASFLKMDNITLGYNFQNVGGTSLTGRLSLSMQNVFTITDYTGLDPEVPGSTGIDNSIWPRPRTFTFGVNLNF